MTKKVVFDVEATGPDPDVATPHCIVAWDLEEEEPRCFRPHEIASGVDYLNEADALIAHHGVEYDVPLLRRFGLSEDTPVLDTRLASRAAYPASQLWSRDDRLPREKREQLKQQDADAGFAVRHSLAAWGIRLDYPKAEYKGGFERFTEDMLAYCIQDVRVTRALWDFLAERIPESVIQLESDVAAICRAMRLRGVAFNVPRALDLMGRLADRRAVILEELRRDHFPHWYSPVKWEGDKKETGVVQTPKRSLTTRKARPGEAGYRNYAAGCPFTPIVLNEFNPGSPLHVIDRLTTLHGWVPKNFTKAGAVQTTEEVLEDLPFDCAPLLVEYKQVDKILGFITGKKQDSGWLSLEKDGRIHGRMQVTGARTLRASHAEPNMGQVPSPAKPYGHECRELFGPSSGKVLVGCDASGLQLRALAHYLAPFDGGKFASTFTDEGSDPHTYMMQGTGLLTRDRQKTWTYAKLFTAGAYKLGLITIQDRKLARERGLYDGPIPTLAEAPALGRQSERALAKYMTGLADLEREVQEASRKGWILALDGRRVEVPAPRLGLNTLLMSAEACVMKKALHLANQRLTDRGLKRLRGVEFVLWVHDEFQLESWPGVAKDVGRIVAKSIRDAGQRMGLRVELDAEWKVGDTWADTH